MVADTPPPVPLVSVIVPTKNSAATLEACLESIKDQKFSSEFFSPYQGETQRGERALLYSPPLSFRRRPESRLNDIIELLVIDNFSTDSSPEIAKKYTDKVFSKGPERSAQRNFGARRATGQFVVFIDSDMELSPKVISVCIESMDGSPLYKRGARGDFIPPVALIIPEESFGLGFWAQCKKLERSFYVGVDWMEAARFFHKDVFIKAGGYDENMVSGEDWDLPTSSQTNEK